MLNNKIIIIIVFTLTNIATVTATPTIEIQSCNSTMYENSKLGFSVAASRDVGPVTRMDGSGLIINIDVFTLDREPLPETLELSTAQAHLDLSAWDMNTSNDISISRYFDGTGFSFIFREGPLWAIDSSIDIRLSLDIKEFSCQFTQQAVQIRKNS